MVFREKSCPKCGGNTWLDLDDRGWYEQCTECGYFGHFEGIRYENGVEALIVSTQDKLEIQQCPGIVDKLESLMKAKVKEARIFVLAELLNGALAKRTLRRRLSRKGISKPAFENALRELGKSGIIKTVNLIGKHSQHKLALWTTEPLKS